jgi:hypothetical protein
MNRYWSKILFIMLFVFLALPGIVWASGEGGATNLVVVADTRRVSGVLHYIANLYNTDPWMFAAWATFLTALWGAILGFLMDKLISLSGLDLRSRKIVEH